MSSGDGEGNISLIVDTCRVAEISIHLTSVSVRVYLGSKSERRGGGGHNWNLPGHLLLLNDILYISFNYKRRRFNIIKSRENNIIMPQKSKSKVDDRFRTIRDVPLHFKLRKVARGHRKIKVAVA